MYLICYNITLCNIITILSQAIKMNSNQNILVKELPVKWEHKSGSKINLFTDSLIMLKNIIRLKKKYKI